MQCDFFSRKKIARTFFTGRYSSQLLIKIKFKVFTILVQKLSGMAPFGLFMSMSMGFWALGLKNEWLLVFVAPVAHLWIESLLITIFKFIWILFQKFHRGIFIYKAGSKEMDLEGYISFYVVCVLLVDRTKSFESIVNTLKAEKYWF